MRLLTEIRSTRPTSVSMCAETVNKRWNSTCSSRIEVGRLESNRTVKTVAIRDTMSGQQTTENQSIANRENAVLAVDLRDYFAAAALQGLMAQFDPENELEHHIAKWSFKAADAMLKAREVK